MVNSLLNTAQQLKGMIEHAKLQAEASKDAAITQVKLQAEAEKKEVGTIGFLLNLLLYIKSLKHLSTLCCYCQCAVCILCFVNFDIIIALVIKSLYLIQERLK